MSRQQRGKVIKLEQKAARARLGDDLLKIDPAEMTADERREALRRLRIARGADPDKRDPEMQALLDSMTPAEKLDAIKRIRAARLALLQGRLTE